MKGGAKYFTHVKTFTKQNVTSEYLSTDFTFTKLEKAIDTYNGWRKQTFTECNDFMMTSPRVDFDFENADSVYKNNILALKGVCVFAKEDSTASIKDNNTQPPTFITITQEQEPNPIINDAGQKVVPNIPVSNKVTLRPDGDQYKLFVSLRYIIKVDGDENRIRKISYVELPVYDNRSLVVGNKDYILGYIYSNFYKVQNITSTIESKSLGQHSGDFKHIRDFLNSDNYFSDNKHKIVVNNDI